MDKKYGIFYNKQFNTLMVALTPDSIVDENKIHDDLVVLKNKKQEIIGINILNPMLGFDLDQTFYSEHPRVVEYVEKKVRPIIQLNQQPQFIISRVVAVDPIPETHLSLCKIAIADDKLVEVICGASNVKVGMYVVFASDGAWMPNSQVIHAGKIHGHVTAGMLCSAKELFLQDSDFNQKGIIELPPTYWKKIGQSFWREYYHLNVKV
jgi:tRNA-binding protein